MGSLSAFSPNPPHRSATPRSEQPSRCERRISRTGRVHFVSRRRQRQHQAVAVLGYRPRRQSRRPRVTLGRYRWLSLLEQVRIRAEARQGVSANRIAQRISRDRRTIDRTLSDARGLRLVQRLAAHRTLWVLVPDAIASLRGAGVGARAFSMVGETLRRHADGGRVWAATKARLPATR